MMMRIGFLLLWLGLGITVALKSIPICHLEAIEISGHGAERFRAAEIRTGFYLAVMDINNSTDLLDGYELVPHFSNTGTSLTQVLTSTLNILQSRNCIALTGPSWSSHAMIASAVAGALSVPIISHTATSSALSSARIFPYFSRTAPSDVYQSHAMAYFCHIFGYKFVATVGSSDTYGVGGTESFKQSASMYDIKSLLDIEFFEAETNFTVFKEHAQQIKSKGLRTVIIYTHDYAGRLFLQAMQELGLFSEDYVFIGSDGFNNEGLPGMVLFQPGRGSGPVYDSLVQRWPHLVSNDSYLYNIFYDFSDASSSFVAPVAYLYDAVFAIAHALQALVDQGLDITQPNQRSNFLQEIRKTSFLGATSHVSFLADGDRASAVYDLVNENNGQPRVVGTVSFKNGKPAMHIEKSIVWPSGGTDLPTGLPSPIPIPLGYRVTNICLSVLEIAVCLIGFVAICCCREWPSFRASSVPFLLVTVFGAALGGVSSGMLASDVDVSGIGTLNNICAIHPVLFFASYSLILSCFIAKTGRIKRIFMSKSLNVISKGLTNKELSRKVVLILALQFICIVVWYCIDMPHSSLYTTGHGEVYVTCTSKYGNIMWGVSMTFILGLLFFVAYLGFRVRNVADKFNESKLISMIAYAMIVDLLVMYFVVFIVADGELRPFALSTGTNLSFCLVVFGLVVPKLLAGDRETFSCHAIPPRKNFAKTRQALLRSQSAVEIQKADSSPI